MAAIMPPATVAQFKARFARDFKYTTGTEGVQDNDIASAFTDAVSLFNGKLWDTTAQASGWSDQQNAFMLLAAHFLVVNIETAGGLTAEKDAGEGATNVGEGVVQSKSVGGVTESYAFPKYITEDAILSQFLRTQYGIRYAQMLAGRITAPGFVVLGDRDPGVGPAAAPLPFQ